MILIVKLPKFYIKASNKQISRLRNIANNYGYNYKSCNEKG